MCKVPYISITSHKQREMREHLPVNLPDRLTPVEQTRHKGIIFTLPLNSSFWPVEKSPKINEFPSCSVSRQSCTLHLYDGSISSAGVWFWALKHVAPSPPLRVTYVPHLFYLSPEHHAGILRKRLHFHLATASQTAQTTCRRDRKDTTLQQVTGNPTTLRQCCCFSQTCESLPLLDVIWMLLPVCAAKVPENTPTCIQATNEQCLYHHWAGSAEHSLAQLLHTVGSELVLSFHPDRTRETSKPTLCMPRETAVLLPIWCTIFHVRVANEYKGRKSSACFPGPFSYFICRYRHISGVPEGRIKAIRFLHFNPALLFPKLSTEHPPISMGCCSDWDDAWLKLTSGDSTAHLLWLPGSWPAL